MSRFQMKRTCTSPVCDFQTRDCNKRMENRLFLQTFTAAQIFLLLFLLHFLICKIYCWKWRRSEIKHYTWHNINWFTWNWSTEFHRKMKYEDCWLLPVFEEIMVIIFNQMSFAYAYQSVWSRYSVAYIWIPHNYYLLGMWRCAQLNQNEKMVYVVKMSRKVVNKHFGNLIPKFKFLALVDHHRMYVSACL